jgi:hypothetical protein
MSAASCVTQLDHQTCRGSSIGRACGSYHQITPNLKVAGSSPAFGYSYTFAVKSFWRSDLMPENSFLRHLKISWILEACQDFHGSTRARTLCQGRLRFFSLCQPLPTVSFAVCMPRVTLLRSKTRSAQMSARLYQGTYHSVCQDVIEESLLFDALQSS